MAGVSRLVFRSRLESCYLARPPTPPPFIGIPLLGTERCQLLNAIARARHGSHPRRARARRASGKVVRCVGWLVGRWGPLQRLRAGRLPHSASERLHGGVRRSLRSRVHAALRSRIHAALRGALRGALRRALHAHLRPPAIVAWRPRDRLLTRRLLLPKLRRPLRERLLRHSRSGCRRFPPDAATTSATGTAAEAGGSGSTAEGRGGSGAAAAATAVET